MKVALLLSFFLSVPVVANIPHKFSYDLPINSISLRPYRIFDTILNDEDHSMRVLLETGKLLTFDLNKMELLSTIDLERELANNHLQFIAAKFMSFDAIYIPSKLFNSKGLIYNFKNKIVFETPSFYESTFLIPWKKESQFISLYRIPHQNGYKVFSVDINNGRSLVPLENIPNSNPLDLNIDSELGLIAVTHRNSEIKIWNLISFKQIATIGIEDLQIPKSHLNFLNNQELMFSRDFSVYNRFEICALNFNTQEEKVIFKGRGVTLNVDYHPYSNNILIHSFISKTGRLNDSFLSIINKDKNKKYDLLIPNEYGRLAHTQFIGPQKVFAIFNYEKPGEHYKNTIMIWDLE